MEELFYNKYLKEERLGRGASSEVWRVVDQQTGVTQAIKIYNPAVAIEDDGIEMLKHEFALMANINHQNLLRPLYFGINGNNPFLVLPYCKNGNLKKKVGQFTNEDGWRLLRDVAGGLAYLHKQVPPIIHQDIKPENILIGDDGSYMLTDFGVSAHARNTTRATISTTLTSAGTMAYMAPEKFSSDKTLIIASDIWSLGAMAFEMLSGEVPFSVGTVEGGVLQKNGADIPDLPETVDPALRDIIYKCLSLEPWDRPKAYEIETIAKEVLMGERPTVKVRPFGQKTKHLSSIPWFKKPITIAAGVSALIALVVGTIILVPKPEQEDELTLEQRYEKAQKLLKDTTTAIQDFKPLLELAEEMLNDSNDLTTAKLGYEFLKELSCVYHYEGATFLWSRILFENQEEKEEKEQSKQSLYYAQMRKYAGILVNNEEAHSLLEQAVKEDSLCTNAESRYQLALDYTHNVHRDPIYKDYNTSEYIEKGIKLLEDGEKIADMTNMTNTDIFKKERKEAKRRKEQLLKEGK